MTENKTLKEIEEKIKEGEHKVRNAIVENFVDAYFFACGKWIIGDIDFDEIGNIACEYLEMEEQGKLNLWYEKYNLIRRT